MVLLMLLVVLTCLERLDFLHLYKMQVFKDTALQLKLQWVFFKVNTKRRST